MTDKKPKSKRAKRRIQAKLVAKLGPWLLRGLGISWRIRVIGALAGDDASADQVPPSTDHTSAELGVPIYSCWHENIPAASYINRNRGLALLISQHRDGQMIASVLESLGYSTVRGSSSAGGVAALRELMRIGRSNQGLVVTPDGPRGPAHSIANGVLFLAATSGRAILASGVATTRQWRAGSWDRMILPKPFAKVVIAYAEPLFVPRAALKDEDKMAECKAKLLARMDHAQKLAQQTLPQPQQRS